MKSSSHPPRHPPGWGVTPPVLGRRKITELLLEGLHNQFGACLAVQLDPQKAANLMIRHIEEKRRQLGLDSR
jgi:anaerobic carbon-monoxide dehydrogenase catalytic subunit